MTCFAIGAATAPPKPFSCFSSTTATATCGFSAGANAMMQAVMTGGTGTGVQIPGIKTAGKTGTAETGVAHTNTTWFVAFAPADAPKVAVAVVLENQHGFGATTAGPIAKAMMEALLHMPSK